MLKKIFFLLSVFLNVHVLLSQVLYTERFNNLSLTSATTSASQPYLYGDVANGMFTINNGSLIADTLTGNYPFRTNGQKQKAWLAYMPSSQTDTFAVSTSWFSPINSASAYLITPTIKNIVASSVLTWQAMAPDLNNEDGYEIYV